MSGSGTRGRGFKNLLPRAFLFSWRTWFSLPGHGRSKGLAPKRARTQQIEPNCQRERMLGERNSFTQGISLDKEYRSVRAVATHQQQSGGSVPSSAQSLLQPQVSQSGSGASAPLAFMMPALFGGPGSIPSLKAPARIWGFLLETQYAGTKRKCLVCGWMVPEAQVLILGEVMPQCPVLHTLRAAQHKVQFTGTLWLTPWHPLPAFADSLCC